MKIVELKLTEETNGQGITAISLVKHPAIEQNWIAFSQGGSAAVPDKRLEFKTVDEDQRIVVGPAMIPDKLIYRKDEVTNEEFFVFFTKDTIRGLSERFLFQGKQNNMTLEHVDTLNDLSVVESWIVEDSEKDKSSVYGYDLPVGTWFVKVKVLNDHVWNLVKEGNVAGFSVEGVFAHELIKNSLKMNKKNLLDDLLNKVRSVFETESPEPEAGEGEKFGTIEAEGADGTITISYPGEVLEAGAAITTEVDGEQKPVPTGEYTLPEGAVLVVAEEGVAGEIREAEAPAEEPAEEMEAEPTVEPEGLKAEQLEKLVDGIAEIIANFKAEMTKANEAAIKEATENLRSEFNAEAEKFKTEQPGAGEKDKIVRGLNKFVKESGK
jgi:hypothetical protein